MRVALLSVLALVAGTVLGEKTESGKEKCPIKTLARCTNCTSLCANPKCNAICDSKGNVVSLNVVSRKYKRVPKAVGKLSHLNQL